MRTRYSAVVILLALFGGLVGCDLVSMVLNQIPLCSVVNCEQLGLIDVAGQKNLLLPDGPDYSDDPTCTLPGYCGPSPWYPQSSGEAGTSTRR